MHQSVVCDLWFFYLRWSWAFHVWQFVAWIAQITCAARAAAGKMRARGILRASMAGRAGGGGHTGIRHPLLDICRVGVYIERHREQQAPQPNPKGPKPMTTINLNDLDWNQAPAEWGIAYGEMASLPTEESTHNGPQFIVDFDLDGTRKARLAVDPSLAGMCCEKGMAFSDDTNDWPVLDALFGREQWQAWLADKTEEMRALDSEDLDD